MTLSFHHPPTTVLSKNLLPISSGTITNVNGGRNSLKSMETLLSICVGIGLSAACGFRIFVPLLVMSVASLTGHLTLAQGFEWVGSYPALVAFAVATCVEIAGYYVPWVDNLLDTIATPAAIIAGTLMTASLVTDLSPFLKWTLAIIAGGGVA